MMPDRIKFAWTGSRSELLPVQANVGATQEIASIARIELIATTNGQPLAWPALNVVVVERGDVVGIRLAWNGAGIGERLHIVPIDARDGGQQVLTVLEVTLICVDLFVKAIDRVGCGIARREVGPT